MGGGEQFLEDKIYYNGLQVFAPPGVHDAVIETIKGCCNNQQNILEIGSGAGAFTKRLHESGFSVTATGIDTQTFKCQEVDFKYLDILQTVSSELIGRYDVVVATEVIEHLENVFLFFRNVVQLLTPGGILVLTTPNVLSIYSRFLFLRSGRVLLCNEDLMERWGHIQVLPEWLLRKTAGDVGLVCLESRGVGSLRFDKLPMWHKWFQNISVPLAKVFLREKFEGEYEGSNLLTVFKKSKDL